VKRINLPLKSTSRTFVILTELDACTYQKDAHDNYLLNRMHTMGWWAWQNTGEKIVRVITPTGIAALKETLNGNLTISK
jgi:hypothetical protein